MCGIGAFFAKDKVLTREQYRMLFEGARKRGRDGFGLTVIWSDSLRGDVIAKATYTEAEFNIEEALDFVEKRMTIGSILMFCARATPETEAPTVALQSHPKTTAEDKQVQPLCTFNYVRHKWDTILVHNGGVTESDVKRFFPHKQPGELDSAALISAYKHHGKNVKNMMQDISGAFAFVMCDIIRGKLISVVGFNPLAHGYICGTGYFLHSDLEVIEQVLQSELRVSKDGLNVWESWYHHYLEPFTIIETDLASGTQAKTSYSPHYIHPTYDNRKKGKEKKRAIVVASGGIDSGVTAAILHKLGYSVTLLHFKYGQKAMSYELDAISALASNYKIPIKLVDLAAIYPGLIDPCTSLLTDNQQDATLTGGDLLKSTVAWVPGRNALFATIAMTLAESMILQENDSEVVIAAGWNQLSEETGGYPDNSFLFNETLERLKLCGYITGSRIRFVPVLQRLTKTETWKLGDLLGFPFEHTVSCDHPKYVGPESDMKGIALCPDCGSTKLSIIAAARAGVVDRRRFTHQPDLTLTRQSIQPIDLNALVGRLRLPCDEDYVLLQTLVRK